MNLAESPIEAPPISSPVPPPSVASAKSRVPALAWVAALLLFALGAALRIVPSSSFQKLGFDEALYRDYVLMIEKVGMSRFPSICAYYLREQRQPGAFAKLPPTRFLYIYSGYVMKRLTFGDARPASDLRKSGGKWADPAIASLHRVSVLFAVLTLAVCGIATWRIFGWQMGLAVLAMVGTYPLLIHMSQHAFVDGFFAFWALLSLWLLWENLRAPMHAGWLSALGFSLACMVLTKENAFFVFVALCGLVAANRWTRFGTVTPRLLLVMVLGPLCGLALLVTLAGGVMEFYEIYKLLVLNAQNLTFAIATGDGPWYRYFVELMNVSPIILCLALSGLATLPREHRGYAYLLAFVIGTYLIMCNVRYGMNLRYTTIWALPLCVFAAAQLLRFARVFGSRSAIAGVLLVIGVCAHELRQYKIFFMDHPTYEFVPESMFRAVNIVKDIKPQPKPR